MSTSISRRAVSVYRFNLIDPHVASYTVLAAGLARLTQIEKDAWSAVDAVARSVGLTDQAK